MSGIKGLKNNRFDTKEKFLYFIKIPLISSMKNSAVSRNHANWFRPKYYDTKYQTLIFLE